MDCCLDNDTIELTESTDDTDEEEDLLEEWVFLNNLHNSLVIYTNDNNSIHKGNVNHIEIYVKIPIPPPEFVA